MLGFVKIITALILSLFLTVNNAVQTTIVHDIPEAKSEAQLSEMTDIFKKYPVNEEITVINTAQLGGERLQAAVALQGLVAKKQANIYINTNASGVAAAVETLAKAGYGIVKTDSEGAAWTYEALLEKFATEEYITDMGYVLYTTKDDYNQINLATNYATVYGWLPVPQELEAVAVEAGLVKKADLTESKCNYMQQIEFYENNKDSFRKDCLIHQSHQVAGLRDLAIQQGFFVMYTLEDNVAGKAMRSYVLNDFEPGSAVLGWCQYEIKFVENITSQGHFAIPSDHCYNNSILSSVELEAPVTEKEDLSDIELDPTKHYVVLMYSDGDNAQWVQNGYNEFYYWQKNGTDVPVTWSYPPLMGEFSSADNNRVLENLNDDVLITGPSGAGYTRLSKMYGDGLAAFSDLTAASMLESGITTLTIIDSLKENAISERAFVNKLGYFARYDNINGGILQLDGERYAAGGGRVFFVNDKPFVSVRNSLWYPTGNMDDVTEEWLREQADIINSYEADINTINGYTVINIHPWTISPESFSYFVSCLDDGIEVITGDELIAAVDKYVPHEDARPEK